MLAVPISVSANAPSPAELAPLSSLGSAPARLAAEVPCPTGALVVAAHGAQNTGIRLSLVIPTYNEAGNVAELLASLEALLTPVLGPAYELIVVDDDSPDHTWEVALRVAQRSPRVRVLRRCEEKGLSTAVIRGWQAARGDVLAVMDADLQHPPEVNLALLREVEEGADLAVASRHVPGGGVSDWSVRRRVLSRGAQLFGLLLLPGVLGRITDPMSGFFMLRRSAIAEVPLDPIGYKILVEVVARGRVRWIREVPYVFRERTQGNSKVTTRLYVHYVRHLLRLRWRTLPESRLLRFCLVGGTGVVVDMLILYLLSDPSTLGFGLTRSKLVAAELAMLSNFLLNDAWTFGDLSQRVPGVSSKLRRFLGFNAICSLGLLLNVLILNALFNWAGFNRYVANAVAIAAVTVWNYWLNRKLTWVTSP